MATEGRGCGKRDRQKGEMLRAVERSVQSRGSPDGDTQVGTGSSSVEVQPHCPLVHFIKGVLNVDSPSFVPRLLFI